MGKKSYYRIINRIRALMQAYVLFVIRNSSNTIYIM